ncbi:MAG: fibronectin type III domain-containing protein [Treponema sp.]|nr:fibronectin type III domain-containing protein [Treponema sp.]
MTAVLFMGCPNAATETPVVPKTTVQFDNRGGDFPVTIYADDGRTDKIIDVNPRTLSRQKELESGPNYFYLSYHFAIKEQQLVQLVYTPSNQAQAEVPKYIEADINTTVEIPLLEDPGVVMTQDVFFSMENKGDFACRVVKGDSILSPLHVTSELIDVGNTAVYRLDKNDSRLLSGYKIDRNSIYYDFPSASLPDGKFVDGHYYRFTFTGTGVRFDTDTPVTFANISPGIDTPAMPENVKVVLQASGVEALVSWTPVTDADSYLICYGRADTNSKDFASLRVEGEDSSQAFVTDLEIDTWYEFYVVACNVTGDSPESTKVRVKTPRVPPGEPQNLRFASGEQLTLEWDRVPGAQSYRVYRAETGETGPYQMIGTSVSPWYTDATSVGGITYYYQVSAVNVAGESTRSSVVTTDASISKEYNAGSEEKFSAAVADINAAEGGRYVINLTGDFSLSSSVIFSGGAVKTIFLRGGAANRTITNNAAVLFDAIPEGVTLVLDSNVTLDGNNLQYCLVTLSGGTFLMKAGSTLKGAAWHAVEIKIYNGGTFRMDGGKITGNNKTVTWGASGGGVVVWSPGNFIMNGGEISGNSVTSTYGNAIGAGVYVYCADFTMNGGSIANNTASSPSPYTIAGVGVYLHIWGGPMVPSP